MSYIILLYLFHHHINISYTKIYKYMSAYNIIHFFFLLFSGAMISLDGDEKHSFSLYFVGANGST